MEDSITIAGLELWTHIGITEAERALEQRLLVDLTLTVDTRKAGESDDLGESVDYERVVEKVRTAAQGRRNTLERCAEEIATVLLNTFPIGRITVTVKKFILPGVREASVSITRP